MIGQHWFHAVRPSSGNVRMRVRARQGQGGESLRFTVVNSVYIPYPYRGLFSTLNGSAGKFEIFPVGWRDFPALSYPDVKRRRIQA